VETCRARQCCGGNYFKGIGIPSKIRNIDLYLTNFFLHREDIAWVKTDLFVI
jgi:hypothetical protein